MGRSARQITDDLLTALHDERAAQARQLRYVADLIDVYHCVPECLVPGAEQLVPAGADGTPLMAEFLTAELAPLLKVDVAEAWALVRDVANLRARHPHLWEAVHLLRVPIWQARRVAHRCANAGLSLDAARWVDARLQMCWGHLSWGRIRKRLSGLILNADRDLARRRAQAAARHRFVHVRHNGDGTSWLQAELDTTDAVLLWNALDSLTEAAITDGATESRDVLRAQALGELARPTDRPGGLLPRPAATLFVHIDRTTLATTPADDRVVGSIGIARAEGPLGALLKEQLVDLLGHHRVTVTPVIDLAGDPSVDSYEIPDRIRRHLVLQHQHSIFPHSSTPARRCDLDHTEPYRRKGPKGQTRPGNLAPLARLEHRAKTHAQWRVRQTRPGCYEWTSPLGHQYVTDNGRTFTKLRQ